MSNLRTNCMTLGLFCLGRSQRDKLNMKKLMMLTLLFLLPETGYTKPYKVDIYYPSGVGPFPVIILSHGAGGPSIGYNKKAEGMARNGRAAIVLDHYSARGEYGVKFQNIPKLSVSKSWREEDIQDLLLGLSDNVKIDKTKVILAGWSAGAGIVLPYISNPRKLTPPEEITIIGAILTYPYTAGCYEEIYSFNVPTIIHFGKLDGSDGSPLSGYHCWHRKIEKFSKSNPPVTFKEYDDAYHGYDLVFLKKRPKKCQRRKYKDGIGEICMAFNQNAFKQAISANKEFLRKLLDN